MRRALREKWVPIAISLSLALATLWFEITDLPVASYLRARLDYLIYDLRLSLSLPKQAEVDPRIVIVDIDERSLAAEGRWPWRRDKIGLLLEQLRQQGVVVTAFDVMFSEPEANAADIVSAAPQVRQDHGLQTRLRELRSALDTDAQLAAAIEAVRNPDDQDRLMDVVLGYVFRSDLAESTGVLPDSSIAIPDHVLERVTLPAGLRYTASLPILQEAAGAAGFFSTEPDEDGVYRRAAVIKRYGDRIYPSLALEAARVFFLADGFSVDWQLYNDGYTAETVRLARQEIPVDHGGLTVIPFKGRQGHFRYVSATDVINGRLQPMELEGKVAFVGTTARGLFDIRSTPVQTDYPGVEIHANVLAGIMDNQFPSRPEWAGGVTRAVVVVVGVVLSLLFPYLSPIGLLVAISVCAGSLFGAGYWAWNSENLVVSSASPMLAVFLIGSTNMAYGYLIENRRRRLLKSQFGAYVPPELVEEMSRAGESYGFDGESREMTVLFCDIRGFTTLSEKLDAQSLKALLNRFFTPMTRVIFENRGTIDKYVGDMIMAFWGAPMHDPEHRRHAIVAALQMLREVARLRVEFEAEGLPSVDIGIGLNTGVMNVGDMGSEYRRAYTVIGDSVNLGSRLEGLTKKYGVHLVVSEYTRAGLEEVFVFRRLDLVQVKGKQQAVGIFEPVCAREGASAELLAEVEAVDRAFELYTRQAWDEAEAAYRALADADPDRLLYQLFLERIDTLRQAPPGEDWDGSYKHTEK